MSEVKQLYQMPDQLPGTDDNIPRGVPISPRAMVDSVADWPLHRVVEYLRKREQDDRLRQSEPCRVYCRSSVNFLNTIIEDVGKNSFGLHRGRFTRYLTYHGVTILQEDPVILDLIKQYDLYRSLSIKRNSPDMAKILSGFTVYAPASVDADKTSFRVYDHKVLSELEELAGICGVFDGQIAQIAMLRSLLSDDLPVFVSVGDRLLAEVERWNLWMSFRASVLEVAVAKWDSLL